MRFKDIDVVKLVHDLDVIDEYGGTQVHLPAGKTGTIVASYLVPKEAYCVEFGNESGGIFALVTLEPEHLALLE